MQSEIIENKVIPVVFGTEYCKEEGGLLLYCLVLVGEVNYHYRGILQFQQNHQAYFQGHLMLYQDMFDNFLAKDPQKWENHKMNVTSVAFESKDDPTQMTKIVIYNYILYYIQKTIHSKLICTNVHS